METMNTMPLPTVPVLPLGNGGNADLINAIMSLKGNNNSNDIMNNPLILLLFFALLGGGNGFGFGNGNNANANTTNNDFNSLRDMINDNKNNELIFSAINGNRDALGALANNLNCSVSAITSAIEGVRNAMSSCCCDIKGLVQSMGYESQLREQANTNMINNSLCGLTNTITNGFANIGYTAERNTNMIIQAQNASTQRLVDLINSNNVNELTEKLNDARLKLSQSEQTQAIISALKPTTTTGA